MTVSFGRIQKLFLQGIAQEFPPFSEGANRDESFGLFSCDSVVRLDVSYAKKEAIRPLIRNTYSEIIDHTVTTSQIGSCLDHRLF